MSTKHLFSTTTTSSLETQSLASSQNLNISSLPFIPILLPTQPEFTESVKTWSVHHQPTTDDQCRAVFRPETEEDVARIVNWARDTGIKVTPKSGGAGGACGRGGVSLDMGAFDKVELDVETETCLLGAGQRWGDVNAKLRDTGYSVLGARTPHVGVGGYMLVGGISWLSHEHGIANDPKNLLGATVVLADGRIIHAHSSQDATDEERDIMFALRGGGGNFGAVTQFKVRAVKTPATVFSGQVFFSLDQFSALAPALVNHINTNPLPTSALIAIFTEAGRVLSPPTAKFTPMISINIYTTLPATHARTYPSSSGGFSWLWDIPGGPKAELLAEGTYEDAINVHLPLAALYGLTRSHQEAFTPWLGEIDVPFLGRCFKWYQNTIDVLGEVGRGVILAVEPMHCSGSFGALGLRDADTAWPHARPREVVQVAIMTPASGEDDGRELDSKCIDLIRQVVRDVPSEWRPSYPNYGDAAVGYTISDVYGANLSKLREIKRNYDPHEVFLSAGLRISPASDDSCL